MSKRLKNIILIIVATIVIIAVTVVIFFRYQGRQRTPELTALAADITELRFRVNDTVFTLYRPGDIWLLRHPAYSVPVAADETAVETLLDELRHWEVRGIATAAALDSLAENPTVGRLRVYTRGRWGGVRLAWDGRWRCVNGAFYLKDGHRLYSRLYDPRVAEGGGEATAHFTADARHWRNRWICHYYYYELARAEWQTADGGRLVYSAETDLTQAAQNQTAALSAFRGVYFDRYAEGADSMALATALSLPPAAVFTVVSRTGDSTRLAAYTLYDTAGQADWFRLCGILTQQPAATTTADAPRHDTVFLSYQLLDRLQGALRALSY